MNTNFFSRHSGILKPKDSKITVVGAGGIGSVTALCLAKMGFQNIEVIDYDEVDEVNIGSQLYRIKDVGRPKVEALAEQILEYSGTKIKATQQKTDGNGLLTGILVLAVDSIDVRKEIAENATFEYMIDGRMGGQVFSIYTYPMEKKEVYLKEHIFPASEADPTECTSKAICYNTFGIASFICNEVKKINNGEALIPEQHYCFVNRVQDI